MNLEQIAAIRAACIKANPEIVELKFGCEIRVKYGEQKLRALIVAQKSKGTEGNAYGSWVLSFLDSDEPMFAFNSVRTLTRRDMTDVINEGDVIGRPIRLADVLLAIKTVSERDFQNQGMVLELHHGVPATINRWKLRADDLTAQGDETISFLAELLEA